MIHVLDVSCNRELQVARKESLLVTNSHTVTEVPLKGLNSKKKLGVGRVVVQCHTGTGSQFSLG
jgi:hypothetical protein